MASASQTRSLLLAVLFLTLVSACGSSGANDDNDDDDEDGDDDTVTYSIGGTVSGLDGTVVLRNNGGNDLSLTTNTGFTFTTELADGASYAVTIASEPADQDCEIANATGTVSGADVTNIAVTCADEVLPDTPAIAFAPATVHAHVSGSALLFVIADGDDLTYTWRSAGGGGSLNEGAEPFYLITDLTANDDGNCYTVTASNAGGEATSQHMCLDVGDVSFDFNEDGGPIEPDAGVGQGFGNLLLGTVTLTTAGPTQPPEFFWADLGLEPAAACLFSGQDLGAFLDGAAVTTSAALPLGRHTIARSWVNCRQSEDDIIAREGGIMISYDFPTTRSVGTMTVHFSGLTGVRTGFTINGSVDVTTTRDAAGADFDEQVIMAMRDELSFSDSNGVFKSDVDGYRTLTMQRSGSVNGNITAIDTAEVDFSGAAMSFHDVDGFAQIFAASGPATLTFDINGTSSGSLPIWSSELGPPDEEVQHCVLVPDGDGLEWELFLD